MSRLSRYDRVQRAGDRCAFDEVAVGVVLIWAEAGANAKTKDCVPRSLSLGRVPWLRSALTRSVEVGASYLGVGTVERMREARKAQAAQFAANILPIVRDIQAAGHNSLNAMARQLNA